MVKILLLEVKTYHDRFILKDDLICWGSQKVEMIRISLLEVTT